MANLLIRYIDNPGTRGTKKWDVIDVRDDSVPFGTREGYPTYLKVHFGNVSVDEVRFLTEPELDPASPVDPDTGEFTGKLTARAYKLLESRLNPPTLAALEAAWLVSGVYDIPDASEMLGWFEKKLGG